MSERNSSHPIWSPRKVHLLIDPDKWNVAEVEELLSSVPKAVGSIIVGGTYLHSEPSRFETIMKCCSRLSLPIGNIVTAGATDSLISPSAQYLLLPIVFGSTNTRFVLDHVVRAVPLIKRYGLPCVAYAYLMLAGGVPTSAEYFTQTIPIPRGKPEILATLSLAAEYLGLAGVYLEAGSGAEQPVTEGEVQAVVRTSRLPVLIGGGISSSETCRTLLNAGATGLVIGTALERSRDLSWLGDSL